jgi:hypothetical protein
MAVLTLNTNAIAVWSDGSAERVSLYAMRKMTAGDTLDLSADFNPPIVASIMGTAGTATGQAGVISSIGGNVITIPAGPSNSAGFLLVYGVHA